MTRQTIESILNEGRIFAPPARPRKRARIKRMEEYEGLYRSSVDDSEGFWAELARQVTRRRFRHTVLEWAPPLAKWFVGGAFKVSGNRLDCYPGGLRRDKPTIVGEGEPVNPEAGM